MKVCHHALKLENTLLDGSSAPHTMAQNILILGTKVYFYVLLYIKVLYILLLLLLLLILLLLKECRMTGLFYCCQMMSFLVVKDSELLS
ncbi:hypothetical protein Hdeb2414_s0014g00435031 [Helianthus debilis subsp. tardiflorus]